MRLIDADALKGHFLNGGEDLYSGYAFHYVIDHIPTVDAVPVCHCEECTLWDRKHISNEGLARCLNGEGGVQYREKRDFCSKGVPMGTDSERKGEDER